MFFRSLPLSELATQAEVGCRRHDRQRNAAMTKGEILRALKQLIHYRLFESGEPLSWTECEAMQKTLEAWGLDEQVPGAQSGTRQQTQLGKEINAHMMHALLGYHDAYEIPGILRTNGLISADEDDRIMDVLNEKFSQDPVEEQEKMWRALLPLLRQAFERADSMGLFD
jgi:hypothetical protein